MLEYQWKKLSHTRHETSFRTGKRQRFKFRSLNHIHEHNSPKTWPEALEQVSTRHRWARDSRTSRRLKNWRLRWSGSGSPEEMDPDHHSLSRSSTTVDVSQHSRRRPFTTQRPEEPELAKFTGPREWTRRKFRNWVCGCETGLRLSQ